MYSPVAELDAERRASSPGKVKTEAGLYIALTDAPKIGDENKSGKMLILEWSDRGKGNRVIHFFQAGLAHEGLEGQSETYNRSNLKENLMYSPVAEPDWERRASSPGMVKTEAGPYIPLADAPKIGDENKSGKMLILEWSDRGRGNRVIHFFQAGLAHVGLEGQSETYNALI